MCKIRQYTAVMAVHNKVRRLSLENAARKTVGMENASSLMSEQFLEGTVPKVEFVGKLVLGMAPAYTTTKLLTVEIANAAPQELVAKLTPGTGHAYSIMKLSAVSNTQMGLFNGRSARDKRI